MRSQQHCMCQWFAFFRNMGSRNERCDPCFLVLSSDGHQHRTPWVSFHSSNDPTRYFVHIFYPFERQQPFEHLLKVDFDIS